MITRVCIIRHGETDWNQEGRIQGQIDIPLNEVGRAQALAMAFKAAHHHFASIYSSDLSRALDTARALATRSLQEVISLAELRERHYGIFQNVCKHEAEEQFPQAHARYQARDPHYDFEHGESLLTFSERVINTFNNLAQKHSGAQIAVICHAGLLDIMYRHATQRALETERDFIIPNCALNWFHHDGHRWHLDAWDDHQHLRHVLLESVE